MADIKFADGLSIYAPHEKAPDFVKGDMVITNDFIKFFTNNQRQGKLRLQLKVSKLGKLYAEVNTYEPKKEVEEVKKEIDEIFEPKKDPIDNFTSPDEDGNVINAEDIPF
jgi:hypothetical protein